MSPSPSVNQLGNLFLYSSVLAGRIHGSPPPVAIVASLRRLQLDGPNLISVSYSNIHVLFRFALTKHRCRKDDGATSSLADSCMKAFVISGVYLLGEWNPCCLQLETACVEASTLTCLQWYRSVLDEAFRVRLLDSACSLLQTLPLSHLYYQYVSMSWSIE